MARARFVLLASLALVLGGEGAAGSGIMYRRAVSSSQAIYSEFVVTDTKTGMPRLSECASHISISLNLPASEATWDKSNSFKYDAAAKTCTLGRLPYAPSIFSAYNTIEQDDADAIYVVKPSCDLKQDMDTTNLKYHSELLEDSPTLGTPLARPTHAFVAPAVDLFYGSFDFDRIFIDGRHSYSAASTLHHVKSTVTLSLNSFTVMSWFFSSSAVTQTQVVYALNPWNVSWSAGFYFVVETGTFPKRMSLHPGTTTHNIGAAYVVPADRWVHLAAVYDYDAMTVNFYMDGRHAEEITGAAQASSDGNEHNIGFHYATGCECSLADQALYDVALTSDQILAAYNRFGLNKVCP